MGAIRLHAWQQMADDDAPKRLSPERLLDWRKRFCDMPEEELLGHIDAIEAELKAAIDSLVEQGAALTEAKADAELLRALLESMRRSRDELSRKLESR